MCELPKNLKKMIIKNLRRLKKKRQKNLLPVFAKVNLGIIRFVFPNAKISFVHIFLVVDKNIGEGSKQYPLLGLGRLLRPAYRLLNVRAGPFVTVQCYALPIFFYDLIAPSRWRSIDP